MDERSRAGWFKREAVHANRQNVFSLARGYVRPGVGGVRESFQENIMKKTILFRNTAAVAGVSASAQEAVETPRFEVSANYNAQPRQPGRGVLASGNLERRLVLRQLEYNLNKFFGVVAGPGVKRAPAWTTGLR